MKATVDAGMCTGCGVCVETCPEVFELGSDNISIVKVEVVPPASEGKVREAADGCPVTCIEVQS